MLSGAIRLGLIGSSSFFVIDLFSLLNVIPNSNSLCIILHYNICGIHVQMVWKFLKQNVVFPKGLN